MEVVPPGGLSAQLAWQLEVSDVALHAPIVPPASTIDAQQTVPEPHSFAPEFPVQSRGWVVELHDAAQVSAPVLTL